MIADQISALMIKAQNSSREEICAILDMFPKWKHDLTLALTLNKQEEELYRKDPEEPYWNR